MDTEKLLENIEFANTRLGAHDLTKTQLQEIFADRRDDAINSFAQGVAHLADNTRHYGTYHAPGVGDIEKFEKCLDEAIGDMAIALLADYWARNYA